MISRGLTRRPPLVARWYLFGTDGDPRRRLYPHGLVEGCHPVAVGDDVDLVSDAVVFEVEAA